MLSLLGNNCSIYISPFLVSSLQYEKHLSNSRLKFRYQLFVSSCEMCTAMKAVSYTNCTCKGTHKQLVLFLLGDNFSIYISPFLVSLSQSLLSWDAPSTDTQVWHRWLCAVERLPSSGNLYKCHVREKKWRMQYLKTWLIRSNRPIK